MPSNDICWNACALPHSGGRVPERRLTSATFPPSTKLPREGNDPLSAQDAGNEPDRGMSRSVRLMRLGNASGLLQLDGRVPVTTEAHMQYSCRQHQEPSFNDLLDVLRDAARMLP